METEKSSRDLTYLVEYLPLRHEALGQSPAQQELGKVVPADNQEVEAGGSQVQGDPQLQRKCQKY